MEDVKADHAWANTPAPRAIIAERWSQTNQARVRRPTELPTLSILNVFPKRTIRHFRTRPTDGRTPFRLGTSPVRAVNTLPPDRNTLRNWSAEILGESALQGVIESWDF